MYDDVLFTVAEHLLAQHNAVKMLHGRIRIILDYVKAVEAGMYLTALHV